MKTIFLVLTVILAIFASGCGLNSNAKKDGDKKIKVVTTIFPEYDWAKNIIGSDTDNVELTLLLDKGVDMHSYQPTAQDMVKISDSDVFIYVGGESDEWVKDALKEAKNKNMIAVNLFEILGDKVKVEETVEGMQEEKHDHDKEVENDEHVWLSLKNAALCCDAITNAMEKVDPTHKEEYKKNNADYQAKLSALSKEYDDAIKASNNKTLCFGDRFPFRYLIDDYDLKYYAAFPGCSAESEAGFETVTFLSGKVDELKLNKIITIDGSDKKIAQTIVNNTKSKNQEILTLDSMQSISAKDIKDGASYLSIMEKNLNTVKEALK